MSCGDVCDLMGHYTGKFRLIISCEQQAFVDEEKAAGKCECVHFVTVNNFDREWNLRIRIKHNVLPDSIHVFRDDRILDHLCLLLDFHRKAPPDRDLFVLRAT